jgi:2-oxoglutarate ferredoxin oxidoreductase subunit alpha
MPKTVFNWKIAGPAGEGIKSTGLIFSKTCIRFGLSTFDYTEYPSLIRGGHNTYQVSASMGKIHSQLQNVDVLVALNENAIKEHGKEVSKDSVIVYDAADSKCDIAKYTLPCPAVDIPLVELAKSVGADRLMYNNVALGVSVYLLGLDISLLYTVIADMFGGKGAEVVTLNKNAAQAGFTWAAEHLKPLTAIAVTKQAPPDDVTVCGNEALALGAIAGGMKAYVAYPMTPASTLLHVLAEWTEKADIFVKHAEDEIGVINMALGMSFAGVRSACGTSGGGFCYMTEAVGFSGVAELPLVIYEVMRPGPALGMPTWTAQGDLQFAIWASQDEFPRIVLAPGDVFEAFELSRQAFDWADKFQVPIIVLSDKFLSESNQSTHFPNTKFKTDLLSRQPNPSTDDTGFHARYTVTETGISPRPVPGQKDGYYMANTYEHDIHGIGSESAEDRIAQNNKRMKKMTAIKSATPIQFYDGSDNPEVTFISFGSTLGPIREALVTLRAQGIDAAAYNLSWMWPFPVEQTMNVIQKSKNTVVVEGNSLNQLAKLIRQETGIDVYHKRTKYDGRPFYPEEIVQYAHDILHR